MMRFLLVILAALWMINSAHADEWVSTMKNIPLAPGLKEVKENGSIMEGPLGPIVIAYAKSDGPADKVREYYEEALPRMGWVKEGNRWRLHQLVLTLDFVGSGRDPVVVTFSLHGGAE